MASVLQRYRLKLKLRWWFVPLVVITMIAQAPQNYLRNNSFVNWESAHVHPLDMTPDGTKLLAVNTANATLEVFNVSDSSSPPTFLKSIPVGVDPVSVRARTNTEAWVVNVISDSVSIVNLTNGVVTKTLQVDDEPADVIFAGSGNSFAFVSCAQAKTLLEFSATSPSSPLSRIPINGEQPRALAVSGNGRYVYLAIFESGNGTTIVPGGVSNGEEPSTVDDKRGPYGGVNPPPNSGKNFSPAINTSSGTPPPVSLIVKRTTVNGSVKWLDDNNGDWSPFITGSLAANGTANAHATGWDLPDRDVAIIDTQSNNAVTYQSGLGNILMSLAVNPASGVVSVVGTDATNQIRFEPNLQSTFVHVQMAQFTPGGSSTIKDLNPHLNYQLRTIPMVQRMLSIGDPRGIVWNAAGSLAYVTGMGSNNVIVTNPSGARIGLVNVGQGPTGIVLQESDGRAFVLNKFDATISTFNLSSLTQTSVTPLYYDPTTPEIKAGRPLLYNTQQTSGLGQASCASCHVDARWDRLSWDLGDPQSLPVTNSQGITFHPMKGPLLTMTLVDSMQAPSFHWRGDRPSLTDFEDAFQTLMGADAPISDAQTALLNNFLSEVTLPPDPYRNLDDSFSTSVNMPGPNNGVYVNGNAVLGAQEFEAGCRSCHVGQTGRGAAFITTNIPFGAGARNPPSWKNLYKRTGLWFTDPTASNSGFGTQQDGTFDSSQNQTRDANMYAFMMSFNGGFPYEPAGLNATNWSNFSSASVGKQVTLTPSNPTDTTGLLAQLETLAANGQVGLIAKGTLPGNTTRGYFFLGNDHWQSDKIAEVDTTETLMTAIASGWDFTFTSVPAESAVRMGIDMDGDGILDGDDAQPSVPNATVTNLALKGTATASGQYDALHGPAAAIDGSTNGYFDQNMLFHSAGGNDDWWQVDLGQMSQISLIQIFNRVDCCSTRLSNVTIFVSPNPFTSTSLTATQAQPGVQQFFLTGYAGLLPQIPMNVQGRYVRIQLNVTQYLQLAEVRVMGYAVASFTNPGPQTTTIGNSVTLPLTLNDPSANTYTFSATGLPPGLAIDPSSGVISGVPTGTASTSYNVTVTANGPGNPTVTFTWTTVFTQLTQTITFGPVSTQTVGTPLTLGATASSGLPITYVSAAPTVCTVSGSIATFLNAGNCGIVATQPGNAAYAAAVAIGQQFIVNAKPAQTSQTITFPSIGTQTVGTSISLLATASSGLAVSYASSTPSVCAISASSASLLASGICTITASQSGNATYSAATPVSQSFTVNAVAVSAPPTIVNLSGYYNVNAIDTPGTEPINGGIDSWQNLAYNSASLGASVTYSGIVFPLGPPNALDALYGGPVALPAGNFNNLYVIATGVDGAWPSQSIVVTYTDGTTGTFTQSMSNWTAASNYAGETVVASPGNQLIASSVVTGTTVNSSSIVLTTPTYLYGYTFPLAAGKTAQSIQFPVNSNIVVLGIALSAKAPTAQTISFGSIAAQPAGTTLALNATASSGLAVSYSSSTPSVCTISGSTAILSAAGTCTVTASQVGSGSYLAATPVSQSFVVNVTSQTITFNGIASQAVGTPLSLTATASSGLAVSFSSSTPSVCTVSGSTATFLSTGTCTITASQVGNVSFLAAPSVSQSFSVGAKAATSQTITFAAIAAQTLGTSLTLNATASSGLPVSYVSSTASVCTISGSIANLVAAGTCAITASQAGNSSYAAATPVSQAFTVNPVTASGSTIVSLAGYYNVNAIATAGTAPKNGGIDSWQNIAYNSATLGTSVAYSGIVFPLGPANAPDAMYGGPVTLPAGAFTKLYVVGTGVDGAWPSQSITVTYTDGTKSTFSQSISNWTSPSNYGVETVVVSAANQINSTGAVVATPSYLYGYTFALTAGKTAQSVQFPVNSNIVVLGIAMSGSTVTPVSSSQSITFGPIASQPVGSTLPLTATASSGLAVSYISLTSSVCTVTGSTAILSAAGTCSITASQAGNATYAAATPVSQSFSVTAVVPTLTAQTIAFNNPGAQTVGVPVALTASASSGLPVNLSSSTTSVCTVSGTAANFTAAGTCTIVASQAGNTIYAAAPSVSQSFSVTGSAVPVSAFFTICQAQPTTASYCTDSNPGPADANGYHDLPTWTNLNKILVSISVSDNHVWGVDKSGVLWYLPNFKTGTVWTQVATNVTQVSAGHNLVCQIGTNLHVLCGTPNPSSGAVTWTDTGATNLKQIAASAGKQFWAIDTSNNLVQIKDYTQLSTTATFVASGVQQVAVDGRGVVCQVNSNQFVYCSNWSTPSATANPAPYYGLPWVETTSKLQNISVVEGQVLGTDSNNDEWLLQDYGNSATWFRIARGSAGTVMAGASVPSQFLPSDFAPGEVAVMMFMGQSNSSGYNELVPRFISPSSPNVWGVQNAGWNFLPGNQNGSSPQFTSPVSSITSVQWTNFNLTPTGPDMDLGYNSNAANAGPSGNAANFAAYQWQGLINAGWALPDLYVIHIAWPSQGVDAADTTTTSSAWTVNGVNLWQPLLTASKTPSNALAPFARTIVYRALQNLLAAGKTPRVIGLQWNQWEAEAGNANSVSITDAPTNYSNLVSGFYGATGTHFPIQFVKPLSTAYSAPVLSQMQTVFANLVANDPADLSEIDVSTVSSNIFSGGIFGGGDGSIHYNFDTHNWFAKQAIGTCLLQANCGVRVTSLPSSAPN